MKGRVRMVSTLQARPAQAPRRSQVLEVVFKLMSRSKCFEASHQQTIATGNKDYRARSIVTTLQTCQSCAALMSRCQ